MNATDGENPYRSPGRGEQSDSETGRDERSSKFESLGRVLVTWEKLRVVYNVIGAIPAIVLVVVFSLSPGELVACAFAANLSYCLGPLVDCYFTWFGFRHRAVTGILFVLGTGVMLFSSLVVGLSFGLDW